MVWHQFLLYCRVWCSKYENLQICCRPDRTVLVQTCFRIPAYHQSSWKRKSKFQFGSRATWSPLISSYEQEIYFNWINLVWCLKNPTFFSYCNLTLPKVSPTVTSPQTRALLHQISATARSAAAIPSPPFPPGRAGEHHPGCTDTQVSATRTRHKET